MTNHTMQQRICKIISQTHALNDDFVWTAYQKLNSFDILLDKIERNELKIEVPVEIIKDIK